MYKSNNFFLFTLFGMFTSYLWFTCTVTRAATGSCFVIGPAKIRVTFYTYDATILNSLSSFGKILHRKQLGSPTKNKNMHFRVYVQ